MRDIIATSPRRRPYGAKFTLLVGEQAAFSIEGECCLLVPPPLIIRIVPQKDTSSRGNQQKWAIFLEGFAKAGEAEQAGLKLALGFLWAAISGRYAVKLIYHTPLPCEVYNRTQGVTISEGGVSVIVWKEIGSIVDPVNNIISSTSPIDPKLLVATELFAAARFETTERARFVGLVSSLEPLAVQQKYESQDIVNLINFFEEHLKNLQIDAGLRASLSGRIDQLRRESVSQAIRRLVGEILPNDETALQVIKDAYDLRSKILHEGSTDADLESKSREVEEVIRRIFEAKIAAYLR